MKMGLGRNIAWLVVGNTAFTLFQWSLVALFAKFYGAAVVGRFALGLAVSAPVFMLANLNLRTILAADVRHEFAQRTYFRLRAISSSFALTVVAVAVSLLEQDRADTAVLLAVALMKYVESFSDIIYGLQQRNEDLRQVGVSLLLKSSFSLLTASLLLLSGVTPTVVLLWVAAVYLLVLVFYDLRVVRRRAEPVVRPGSHHSGAALARKAAPLGLVAALISLEANIPRYAVEMFAGTHELGIYAGVAFILMAGNNLVLALCQATVARLARYHAERRYGRYLRTTLWMVGGILLACIVGAVAARWVGSPILVALYNEDFRGRETLFVTLMLAGGLGYAALVLSYATTAARRFRVQVIIYGVSAAMTAAACAWLGPGRGAEGAAYGRSIGWAIQFLLFATIMARDLRRRFTSEAAT
jgi:O-antigen/teichoic acid export membrane protein